MAKILCFQDQFLEEAQFMEVRVEIFFQTNQEAIAVFTQ